MRNHLTLICLHNISPQVFKYVQYNYNTYSGFQASAKLQHSWLHRYIMYKMCTFLCHFTAI